MKKNVEYFQKHKYVAVKNVIDKDLMEVVYQYTLFDEDQDLSLEVGPTPQIHNSHSKYADPLMETLLLKMLPVMEKNTGLKLIPTYSYYRVYRPGADLVRHVDRPACEISTTLCIGYHYEGVDEDYDWPIIVDDINDPGTAIKVHQDPGDCVIYRGTEVPHGREVFDAPEGSLHSQVFLHYVDANGPYADVAFDGRPYVGYFKETKLPSLLVDKPYIIPTGQK